MLPAAGPELPVLPPRRSVALLALAVAVALAAAALVADKVWLTLLVKDAEALSVAEPLTVRDIVSLMVPEGLRVTGNALLLSLDGVQVAVSEEDTEDVDDPVAAAAVVLALTDAEGVGGDGC